MSADRDMIREEQEWSAEFDAAPECRLCGAPVLALGLCAECAGLCGCERDDEDHYAEREEDERHATEGK